MGTAEPDKTGASAAEDKPAEKVKEDTVSMQPVKRAVGANRGMDTQEDADERELGIKWRGTLAWAVVRVSLGGDHPAGVCRKSTLTAFASMFCTQFIVLWYWLLQSSLAQLVPPQEDARRELFKRVMLQGVFALQMSAPLFTAGTGLAALPFPAWNDLEAQVTFGIVGCTPVTCGPKQTADTHTPA